MADRSVRLYSFGGGSRAFHVPANDLTRVSLSIALILLVYACFGVYALTSLVPAVALGAAPGIGFILRLMCRSVMSDDRLREDDEADTPRPLYDRLCLPAYLIITGVIIAGSIRELI